MRTVRIEASRGYCGCRHELIRPYYGTMQMTLNSYRRYRYTWIESFIDKLIKIVTMCVILVSLFAICYNALEIKRSFGGITQKKEEIQDISRLNVIGGVAGLTVSEVIDSAENNLMIIQEEAASVEIIEPIIEEEVDTVTIVEDSIGDDLINVDGLSLKRYDLPDVYYPGLDFSSFQPYMGYNKVTNKKSPAYAITHSEHAYTDENGLRRYKTTEDQFTIDGKDDYIVALGTFYKEKGTAGGRYLIVTSTGMYTAITGDEKADVHTDSRNMFSLHADGTFAGIIEWIVDTKNLDRDIKRAGSVTAGPDEVLQGEILYIYGIE